MNESEKQTCSASDKVIAAAVRIACIKRGWQVSELARRIGILPKTFYSNLARGDLGPQARAAVEREFGFTETLWSYPRELLLRKACFLSTGTDPGTLRKGELQGFASQLGIQFPAGSQRVALLERVLEYIAANPQKFTTNDQRTHCG